MMLQSFSNTGNSMMTNYSDNYDMKEKYQLDLKNKHYNSSKERFKAVLIPDIKNNEVKLIICPNTGSDYLSSKILIEEAYTLNHDVKLDSFREQLTDLRRHMGFNISELARILKVKRPTIYEWLDDKMPKRKNQDRLNLIYSFCQRWIENGTGQMGFYIHRKLGKDNRCLIDLLAEENLKKELINKKLDIIEKTLRNSKSERNRREQMLKSKGFETISGEEKRLKITKLIRTIS